MQFGENHMWYNNVRAKIAWPAFLTVFNLCSSNRHFSTSHLMIVHIWKGNQVTQRSCKGWWKLTFIPSIMLLKEWSTKSWRSNPQFLMLPVICSLLQLTCSPKVDDDYWTHNLDTPIFLKDHTWMTNITKSWKVVNLFFLSLGYFCWQPAQ